jgi:hypothetical protein
MISDLQCPADQVMINENKVRIVAFFVLIAGVAFILTGYVFIIVFLLADFFLRVFNFGNYSLLSLFADSLINLFKIKNRPTDRAPKRFAAGVGLVFVLFILTAAVLNYLILAISIAAILVVFAALESFFNFCAGCYVYTILQNITGKFNRLN